MTDPATRLTEALRERDRILAAMDVEAAKTFISKHGGFISSRPLDWIKVLHLARLEVTSLPEDLIRESRIFLAQNGAQSIPTLPATSPYLRAAMDLIFPEDLTDAFIEATQ